MIKKVVITSHREFKLMNRLVILFVTAALAGCADKNNQTPATTTVDSVQVFLLKKEPVSKMLSLPAELHPWERAELFAKVEGYVRELKVDIGSRVKKNDVLIIIDAPEITANYAKATADLQGAQSRYHTSLDTYRRMMSAAKERGAVSDNELERVRNQMLTDSAAHEASKSAANAYAQLKNYLTIHAAFDGIITQRNVDAGTLVGKNPTPLLVLENLSQLRVRVAVPEIYTSAIPVSASINFTVDAQPSKKYSATLARKSNQIDSKTRTELWEFEAANTKQELKSGMYGSASFNLQRSEPSFVVPYSAVVTTLEKSFVIRVRNGKTEWIDVRSGINMSDKVEIFGDLQEGDQLILRANDEIISGKSVVVKYYSS
ncbi:efflux RND transporter periplasmic adaptor subunit [Oscillatoria amoena NRMC-F 0135]|nr:efflux RND transporter periplasmic adaptor subunit [Oscillatoria amoena NRMC-F 0135]